MGFNDSWYTAAFDPFNTHVGPRAVMNQLGITSPPPPDLTQSDAYKNLVAGGQQLGANYDTTFNQMRGDRNTADNSMAILANAANGTAPSAAEAMLRKSTDTNAANALGLSATMGGSNPGMALRSGLAAAGGAGAATAADAAALRANELAQARGQYSTAAQQQYGTSMSGATGTGNTYASTLAAPYQALRDQQQLNAQNNAGNQTAVGGIIGTAGKMIGSDPAMKHDIRDGSQVSDEFLDSLTRPKTYAYDNPSAPGQAHGRQLGVMATDLPKHDVRTGPDGKRWISAEVIGDILAGMGRLHERQTMLEGRGGEAARAMVG
jgi:hypothetical protein